MGRKLSLIQHSLKPRGRDEQVTPKELPPCNKGSIETVRAHLKHLPAGDTVGLISTIEEDERKRAHALVHVGLAGH